MRVGLITLGCDKNTVDNEYLAGLLEDRGCAIVSEPEDLEGLDAVVVATCGFIGDAKKQSLDCLVALADHKNAEGWPKRLFVAGCFAQRHSADMLREIPEIDGIAGVGQFERLAEMILEGAPADKNAVTRIPTVDIYRYMRRRRLDRAPHAFLKIADGCNHRCAFCSIPRMKGRYRSVAPDILLREAQALLRQGVRELNLVAQDISVYGHDREYCYDLVRLLHELCAIPGDFWIRCLYCYPGGVTAELLRTMAEQPKIVPYLDIPLQHFDLEVLQAMRRPSRALDAARLVERIRAAVPGITLRTTMIVGFPGETARAHRRMLEGIEALRFERLGAFMYSREEDTAASMAPRQVGEATKVRRWNAVMDAQAAIAAEWCAGRIGSIERVLIEGYDEGRGQYFGRGVSEAPEADGAVYVESSGALQTGSFVDVEITEAEIHDVVGRARRI